MNEEMQFRYLYFLTKMYSGTDRWNEYYAVWSRMSNSLTSEKYSEIIASVVAFHKKYTIKRSRRV